MRVRPLTGALLPRERLDQRVEHSANLVDERERDFQVRASQVGEAKRELKVSLELRERAARDGEVTNIISTMHASVAFGDVRRDGNC